MKFIDDYYKQIIKNLNSWMYQRDVIQVYKDCLRAMTLDLATKTDSYKHKERCEELENLYKHYDKNRGKFNELISLVTEMLSKSIDNFGDHLGHIYMQIIPSGKAKAFGQFFTPYSVSYMLAKMNGIPQVDGGKVISINDPASGAGGMLVACCEVYANQDINYAERVLFFGNDIDRTCVDMTYLQLSYLGASAIVDHQNTLTQEKWDTYRTPAFLLIPSVQKKYKQMMKDENEM